MATTTECKSNELLFSTANTVSIKQLSQCLFTEDLLFTKAYKAIETSFSTVHSLVHAQLNARAVGGCFEIL
jgi:hypothetical protein